MNKTLATASTQDKETLQRIYRLITTQTLHFKGLKGEKALASLMSEIRGLLETAYMYADTTRGYAYIVFTFVNKNNGNVCECCVYRHFLKYLVIVNGKISKTQSYL